MRSLLVLKFWGAEPAQPNFGNLMIAYLVGTFVLVRLSVVPGRLGK